MTSHSTSFTRKTRTARAGLAAGVAGFGLLTLAGCAIQQAQAVDTVTTTGTSATSETSDTASTSTYADGTYSAESAYQAPGGIDSVTVELTIADDVITAVSVSGQAEDHEGMQFIDRFASAISSEVVGKDLSTLSVSRVAGSSLTSNGFNSALDAIRSQAD
jgi:hypothetical protein